MTIKEQQAQEATLKDVRKQFEQWRQTRKKRGAIPDNLWEAAIELSKRHSPHKVSQTLHLNSSDLSKRIEQSRSKQVSEATEPKFIDFEIGNRPSAECTIEMAHSNGTAIKAHIKVTHIDFLQLSKIFWGDVK